MTAGNKCVSIIVAGQYALAHTTEDTLELTEYEIIELRKLIAERHSLRKPSDIITSPELTEHTRIDMRKLNEEFTNVWPQDVIDTTAVSIHQIAVEKGWWDEPKELTNLCMKIIEGNFVGNFPMITRTAIAEEIRKAWPKRNIGEMLMLVVTELAEAYEEYRSGKWDAVYEGEGGKPEGGRIEVADAVIRLFDLAAAQGWQPGSDIARKVAFNRTRPHRHGGKLA